MIESGQDEVRETLLKASFHEFLQSPILGNAFLIQNYQFEGSYPHNSIVESLMATGAIGGGVFILLIWKVFTKAIKLIKNRSSLSWISFVFLQYLIFSFFSSNLYSNQLFWILLVLVSGINTNSHRTIIDS